jgi:pimeloyl-ACP methyl ester carboxylesterase
MTAGQRELSDVAPAGHTWRSRALGRRALLPLDQGPLQYFERGTGPVLVFAHGWLANANLWRGVVDRLAARFRCITLDLPFGSHLVPMRADADLSPGGCGALIAAAIAALDLADAVLVGNDSGGAYSQIALANVDDLVGRVRGLVLNTCETPFDEFPPPPFDALPEVAADPAQLRALLSALEDPEARHSPLAYGQLIKRPIPAEVSDSYALPSLRDELVLRDTAKVWSAATSEPVHRAGAQLIARCEVPVLFAWSPEDLVFPVANARRYAAELRHGQVELVEDAYAFTPEDQPAALAEIIRGFAAS